MLNKNVADRLAMAEKTVKVHRASAMKKMGARSVADLVRMAEKAGIHPLPTK
jgi:FixJ family two-component response regulator